MSRSLSVAVIVPQVGLASVVPALPRIAQDLRDQEGASQYLMTSYLAGYALSMLMSGLLADRYGARRVQVWGLWLFTASSTLCAGVGLLPLIAAARFLQGLGGSSATVLTRLIVQRRYPEAERMRVLTTLASVIALTPCLAPVAGGWLTEHAGWRMVFLVMAAVGLAAAVLFATAVPGDPPPAMARLSSFAEVLRDYAANLRDPSYCGYAAAISLVSMAQLVFVSHSAHPLVNSMGVSPTAYGLLLSVSALGTAVGATAVRLLSRTCDVDWLLRLASVLCGSGGTAIVAVTLALPATPSAVVVPMIAVMSGVGATVPLCQAGLLRTARGNPGSASGLFFFLQLSTATLYSAVMGRWAQQGATSLGLTILLPCLVFWLMACVGRCVRTAGAKPHPIPTVPVRSAATVED